MIIMVDSFDWTLSRGVVFSADKVYVLAYSEREEGSRIFRWTGMWDNYYVPCKAVGISAVKYPQPEIITLCLGGEIHSAGPGGFSLDEVDTGPRSPVHVGILRCISTIDNEVYVTGLGRQVYKRLSSREWVRLDEEIVEPIGSEEINGFESIDGYSSNEVYAVGMNGDSWEFDGLNWKKIYGLTNVVLEKVVCAPDGFVYMAGQLGILIKGRRDQWEIVGQDICDDTVWDLAWFQDKLWLSTVNALYIYEKNEFIKVDMKEFNKSSFRYLAGNDEVLWSIGSKDILVNKDGIWSAIPNP